MPAALANIRELLETRVEQTPNKDFVVLDSGDRVFTYRQFDDDVNRAATLLIDLGVAKGDRVSLLLGNRAEYYGSYKLPPKGRTTNSAIHYPKFRDRFDLVI